MDNELFGLCKEVYEKTGWYEPSKEGFMNEYGLVGQPWIAPLYTSDYLLEKLPASNRARLLRIQKSAQGTWWAEYGRDMAEKADTPLKALLKLAIALKDAGEIL